MGKQKAVSRVPLTGVVCQKQIGSFNSGAKSYWDQMLSVEATMQVTRIRPDVFRNAAKSAFFNGVFETSVEGVTLRFCVYSEYFYFFGDDVRKIGQKS